MTELDNAGVRFDRRYEVSELLHVMNTYVKEHPEDADEPTIKWFHNFLNMAEWTW